MEQKVTGTQEHATEVTEIQLEADAGRHCTLNIHMVLAEIRTNGEGSKIYSNLSFG